MWGELAKYMTNLQLFQLFLHFFELSSHCLCSRKTLFCCLDPHIQQTLSNFLAVSRLEVLPEAQQLPYLTVALLVDHVSLWLMEDEETVPDI